VSERKKPIKLDWQGGLKELAAQDATKVVVKLQKEKSPNVKIEEAGVSFWSGTLRIRKETKGRGGKAVLLLFDFTPMIDQNQMRELSSWLKEKLACGGGFDDTTCVVQSVQKEVVEQALLKRKCKVIFAGGF
jgi:translation initiation factor 1